LGQKFSAKWRILFYHLWGRCWTEPDSLAPIKSETS
jgi:hypothetical protein